MCIQAEHTISCNSVCNDVDALSHNRGIDTTHSDFGGRASFGVNFASDFSMGDPHGHGTHVAGKSLLLVYILLALNNSNRLTFSSLSVFQFT